MNPSQLNILNRTQREQISSSKLSLRRPEIIRHRIIDTFFRRVLNEHRPINTLTIVSPWISRWEVEHVGLERIRDMVDHRHVRTLILTRPPNQSWHSDALDMLNLSSFVTIHLIPHLHAKVFLCESIPVPFGLVGSANLTSQSLQNVELGVLFEGRGDLSHLIRDLKTLAWQDLRSTSQGKYL